MLKKIIQWAKTQADIRAILLTSSRARGGKSMDEFSDYDIELYAIDTAPYTKNDDWIRMFGEVMIMLPEKRYLLGMESASRLVIYKDDTKIDFTIAHIDVLTQVTKLPALPDWLDDGYKVLLDKGNLTINLKKPRYKAYIPKKPGEKEYQDLIKNFWWETTYVAKNLRRLEIFSAKYSSDCVIRYKILLKMLEWYVQIDKEWKCRTGFVGKGIEKLLKNDEQNELNNIFSGAGIEENQRALDNTIIFFRKIAKAVAEDLGFEYPQELDKNVSEYIARILSGRISGS
jgi:aminoglycoside 6-adenylyltransferase